MLRNVVVVLSLFFIAGSLHADSAVIALEKSTYTFREDAGTGTVTLLRSGNQSVACSIHYHVSVDTVFIDSTANFASNEASKTVSFPIPNNNAYDNGPPLDDFFSISGAVNAVVGPISNAAITIIDDDPFPIPTFHSVSVAEGNSGITLATVTVTLSTPFRYGAILYAYALGGTAIVDLDYYQVGFGNPRYVYLAGVLFNGGQTTSQFVVYVAADTLPGPDKTIVMGLDNGDFVSGTLTILNDDYILTPNPLKVIRGSVGTATISTSVPASTTDRLALSSDDPSVASVPPFVDVPAGSLGASFDVTAVNIGSVVIRATAPPSRGGVTTTTRVDVHIATTASFDQPVANVQLGRTTVASMHFDPAPTSPAILFLSQSAPLIADIPAFVTVGPDGSGTLTVRGVGVGSTNITAAIPDIYGGGTASFVLVVTGTGLTIARLDSTSGPSTGGQLVKIFAVSMSGRCTATFDGVSGLNTTMAASGFLTTSTPPHDAGTVAVTLRCGDETSTLPGAYTYTALPSRLSRITPSIGSPTGGVVVTATGDFIRRGRCSLSFGGAAATTMENDSATEIVVAAPPHAPGTVDVSMRCGSDVSTLFNDFIYTADDPLPQVAGTNPAFGAPGERVIVSGSGLRVGDAIFFDGTPGLDVTTASGDHLVTVPDVSAGNVTITLTDILGRAVSGTAFRVLATTTPQLMSAPDHVVVSSEFLINGAGFRRSVSFLLGGTVLQPLVVESTFARLRLPSSITAGSYPLTIAGSPTAAHMITVVDGIAVTSVSIPCSSTEGGPFVTITGNGFAAGAVVAFGATDSAEVSVHDEHTIVARVPPSSGITDETIIVTNPTGESGQLSNSFHYRWPDPGCGTTRRRGTH